MSLLIGSGNCWSKESELIQFPLFDYSTGNEVYFKVKRTTEVGTIRSFLENLILDISMSAQFRKVMNAYCKKVGADPDSVRFLFDGVRIRPEQTPADVGIGSVLPISPVALPPLSAEYGGRGRDRCDGKLLPVCCSAPPFSCLSSSPAVSADSADGRLLLSVAPTSNAGHCVAAVSYGLP